MRKNLTAAEIGEAWVKQSQPSARCSSMSFEGLKFYSYGTVIAQIVKSAADKRVYLLNNTRYSSTSSMHQNLVKSAIPKTAKVVEVPGVDRWMSGTFFDHQRIFAALSASIEWRLRDAELSREPKKSRLKREAKQIEKRISAYMKLFGLRFKTKKKHGFDLPTVVARYGSEGHHYLAGLGCVTPNSVLEAAQEMAQRRGLL